MGVAARKVIGPGLSTIPNNLGMVIKATKLDAFEAIFEKLIQNDQHGNQPMHPQPQSGAADG